jgi:hypothetical protein
MLHAGVIKLRQRVYILIKNGLFVGLKDLAD